MTKCILCETESQSEETYIECPTCHTNFPKDWEILVPPEYNTRYEELYPGMQDWCQNLKLIPNPWRAIANRGEPYAKVMEWFMNQDQKLSVLDIGCGWGYVVHILKDLGFSAVGIDISNEAVDFAVKTFGQDYMCGAIEQFKGKMDIVLALEVFEHVNNPREFLKKCLEIAPKVIITTPNLTSGIWISELPPIHMACYRKESLEWLAKDLGVKVKIEGNNNLFAIFDGSTQ